MAVQHGSRTKYNSGCRCEACVQANRDYNKARGQALRAKKHAPAKVTTRAATDRALAGWLGLVASMAAALPPVDAYGIDDLRDEVVRAAPTTIASLNTR